MDTKKMFNWTDLLNSSLIKTTKRGYVGFAGFKPPQNKHSVGAFFSCVFRQKERGNEVLAATFGPFESLDLACTAVENYIVQHAVFADQTVPEVVL